MDLTFFHPLSGLWVTKEVDQEEINDSKNLAKRSLQKTWLPTHKKLYHSAAS